MKNNATLRTFITYVVMNMLGMLGVSCYILADTYFIANGISANALTALNLALPIFGVINSIGLLFGIGSGTRYTILKSNNKEREAQEVFSQTIMIGLGIGIGVSMLGMVGSRMICEWLGADVVTLEMMNSYLKTILSVAPFFILNHMVISFVRNDKGPRIAMIAMLLGSFVNIVLDYVFIYHLGMGIFGAALATGIAPMISLSVLLTHFLKEESSLRFIKCGIQLRTIKDSCGLGLSACVTELSAGIVLLVFNLVILRLAGNVAVAAYGIVANISLVCMALFTGIAQGIQPLISRYYGDGDLKKVHQVLRYALCLVVGVGVILYMGITLWDSQLVAVFNKEQDQTLAQLATGGMNTYFLGIMFAGINIVGAAYLSAIEKNTKGFMISVVRGFALIIPSVAVLAIVWGLDGVWLSFVCTEALTACFTIWVIGQSVKGSQMKEWCTLSRLEEL